MAFAEGRRRAADDGAGSPRVAQRQLRFVREHHYPGARGKQLTVVRCGPIGIAKRSVPLLVGDELAA
jgi:hypothetical protein